MKIINRLNTPLVTIVGCQHGNERLGLVILEQLQKRQEMAAHVQYILANEAAVEANCRFLDQDLNRSFPGNQQGNREERLAHELLPYLQPSQFVLDLHTTTSDITVTPIVTNLNDNTRRVLNLCQSREIAFIDSPLADKSLIGQLRSGISLEYNAEYAKTPEATEDVFRIVRGLIENRTMTPFLRSIFHVTQPVDVLLQLSSQTKNFVYSTELQGYPFLFGEQSYPNGLLATRLEESVV